MLLAPLVLACAGVATGLPRLHLPHDTVYSVACGPTSTGELEILVVTVDMTKVLRSVDDGLSWETVVGDQMERMLAREVVYYQRSADPSMFVIGTNNGIWAYDRNLGKARSFSGGLPGGDRDILDIDAPEAGQDGPLLCLTRKGNLYLRHGASDVWQPVLSTGLDPTAAFAAVAVAPKFEAQSLPGPARSLAAAIQGRLYLSADGGQTWQLHSQFDQATQSAYDWQITSIAMARNLSSSQSLVIGRSRLDPQNNGKDQGEIWRSGDSGQTFQRVYELDTGVGSLVSTPLAPDGERYFLAAGFAYPNHADYQGTGILRSKDFGLTWLDSGNEQDFILERGAGNNTGEPPETRVEQAFAVSSNFSEDGMLLYGRAEGLFQSKDAGVSWLEKRVRMETQMRDVLALRDYLNHTLVYGATYGSTTLLHEPLLGTTGVLDTGSPMSFQKALAASPNFVQDGTLAVAGFQELALWQDPRLPLSNPRGGTGWTRLPLYLPQEGGRLQAYCRVVALSPNYDALAGPGSDQCIYIGAWTYPPMRSRDNGATLEVLDQMEGGGTMPFLKEILVAPTYEDASSAGRTDVYGITDHVLFRLEDTIWKPLRQFSSTIRGFALDPAFSRPVNPRMFFVLDDDPWVVEYLDLPGGGLAIDRRASLDEVRVTDLSLPPDFSQRPVLYVSTWGRGVKALELQNVAAGFRNVGGDGFPSWGIASLACGPDFATSRAMFIGTLRGFVAGADLPGAPWIEQSVESNRDDLDHGIAFFAPEDPENPQPRRVWPWLELPMNAINPNLSSTFQRVSATVHDGSYLTTSGYAKSVQIQTYAAPNQGKMQVDAYHYFDGQLLASKSVDLGSVSGTAMAWTVDLDLNQVHPIRLVLQVELSSGESFGFDGISMLR
ncbi:MAG: hypothetical protein DWQ01_16585 [Planctomycetota bacterium]|nr:MAG: hypothetical protein DWQ01_16585 [Planctomycetota bacterium]